MAKAVKDQTSIRLGKLKELAQEIGELAQKHDADATVLEAGFAALLVALMFLTPEDTWLDPDDGEAVGRWLEHYAVALLKASEGAMAAAKGEAPVGA